MYSTVVPHMGDAVRHRRRQLGWSQAELIRRCKCISKGYLSQWERGKVPDGRMSVETVEAIEMSLLLEPGTLARFRAGRITLNDLKAYGTDIRDLSDPLQDIVQALRGEPLFLQQVAEQEIVKYVAPRGEVRVMV